MPHLVFIGFKNDLNGDAGIRIDRHGTLEIQSAVGDGMFYDAHYVITQLVTPFYTQSSKHLPIKVLKPKELKKP